VSPLKAGRPRLAARWRSFEGWVGTGRSAAALLVLALAVFALQSLVLPAYPGRDMDRYLQAFVQLGYHVPVYPAVLNSRGPLAALGVGVPLELGAWAAEVWLALLYALSIVAWGRVALTFGARAAVLTTGLLLAYPGYGILFHQLASDSLFAAAFAGWAVLLTRAILRPSIKAFLFVGVGLGVLVLVRPANQVLIVMALLPLVLRAPWRERLAWLAAFFVAAIGVTQSWKAVAELRYGVAVTLKPSTGLIVVALVLVPLLLPAPWRARVALLLAVVVVSVVAVKGWPGQSPSQYARSVKQNESLQFLYRAFELDRIFSPDNGPASRRLAHVVKRDLLTREPYRAYGVDVETFFSSGSDRVFGDLTGVAPAADLAAATREAIRRHPKTFAVGIARTLGEELWNRPVYAPEALGSHEQSSGPQAKDYVVIDGRRLPRPTEGQPIPSSAIGPALWTPGGPASEVWRSPTDHRTVFTDPRDRRRFEKFERDVSRLTRVPDRSSNRRLVHWLNRASHGFPPLIVWLAVGLITLGLRRPAHALVAIAPSIAALVVIAATSLVAPSVAEYAAPVSPAFVMLAATGLLGASGRRSTSPAGGLAVWRGRLAKAGRPGGIAVGLAAAAWAAWHYLSLVDGSFGPAGLPHDLAVFLNAAGSILHGHSPYVFRADATYAYPPLVAVLAAPLHPLSAGVATLLWTLLSLTAIAAALWLLGLRDWRCYALVAVYPITRSAVDLGTIGPFLLLAVALAWRCRDHPAAGGAAAGAAVALKLFLWPIGVWLALTRRVSAALATLGFAVVLVLVPWAALAFEGLGRYPSLLRHLARDEATSSYSLVAIGVRLHVPEAVATVLSLLVAVGFLAAAAWIARDERRDPRERDVVTLTLALAAALAASPIVWVHYFLLLLVPLVLTRPRLSPLWFLPLAYYPLGESAWPAGSAGKLGLAIVVTLGLLLAVVGPPLPKRLSASWPRLRSELRPRPR
jgi:glycosyl transferase family 87/dolichyl-phosphate-mannose-protein mannosyltransferase